MKIQNFLYLAFPVTFKIFFGLFQFIWDIWHLRNPVVCKNLNTISFLTVSESNFPFYFIVIQQLGSTPEIVLKIWVAAARYLLANNF